MRRPRTPSLTRLRESLTRLDADSIDRLYGLEPVWEPGAGAACVAAEEYVTVRCPYCGERLQTRVEATAQEAAYIEDCEVCCRPIEFQVERADSGGLLALQVRRLD
jgi:cysteine-rich CPXCG protein